MEGILYHAEQKIKSEPKDKTPPYLPQYGEQWLGENIPGALQIPGSSTNPFGQEMWAAQTYGQHPSTSPNLQPVSPQMGQNLHVLTSSVPAMSPNMQPMSPNMPLSPHAQVMSPRGQVLSPHGQVMSPHGQVMSPHGQVMSPHGQVMSPHGQVMSPHGQAMSPHGQVMSPHGQVMSPHGQTLTHNLQVMSPQHMGRISPNMQHPQANMGHISPNLVQQVQQIQPTQAQLNQGMMDTDTNSTPSLSNLLLDRGESLTLYSGELSALLGD